MRLSIPFDKYIRNGHDAPMDKLADLNAAQRAAARPRALKAIRLREAGLKWREIGHLLGVTRQRAQALAAAHGKVNGKG